MTRKNGIGKVRRRKDAPRVALESAERAVRIARQLRVADLRAGGYAYNAERLAEIGGSNMVRANIPPVRGPRDP